MRSTLDEVIRDLGELRSLISSIDPVNRVLASNEDSVVRDFPSIRRRFDYAAFAVALYASFERFSEELVVSYARLLAQRIQYSQLPSKLRKKHMDRSADLLRRRLGEGRYADIREVDLIKNLYECLTDQEPYVLNPAAVAAHDVNLRKEELNNLFSSVGLENICDVVSQSDPLLEWYALSHLDGKSSGDSVPGSTIEQRLKDVIERRNQVAHRGGSPTELLGQSGMSDAVSFIEAFVTSIFSVVVGSHLAYYVTAGTAQRLTVTEGPFKNESVVVVKRPSHSLRVRQPAFVLSSAGARWGRVVTLKLNDEPVDTVDHLNSGGDVGIEFDFRVGRNIPLYVLEREDDAIWGPS